MNLITGIGGGLTEEEIYDVATPTMTPTTGNDLARLNQQYNDTFLKFLVQNPENPQTTAPVYDSGSPEGEGSGLMGGEYISPYVNQTQTDYQVFEPVGGDLYGGSGSYSPNNQQYGNFYTNPADIQFQMGNVFDGGYAQNQQNNQGYVNPYELYGNLQFPVFGSGVTSLVPQDAIDNMYLNRGR